MYPKRGGQKSMKKLREGWHIVAGYSVYVDSDGMIRHGTKKDSNGSLVPAYPYYWSYKYNCWTNAPCTPSQLYHSNWSMK
jgi:hypothetical protein